MGWWKCNEHGGIDFKNKPSGNDGESLINAIPGRDTTEDYYNGDSPADAMYLPIAIIKSWFINRQPKPSKDQLVKLFTEKVTDNVFKHIDKDKLNKLVDITWREIDAIYNETWGRPPYPEEKYFVCSFSFGGADGWTDRRNSSPSERNKDRLDWWKLRAIEEDYIKNFNEDK